MSLALHKIVNAIRLEENVVKGVAKLERYSLSATASTLAVREIAKVDGALRINGKLTQTVASQLAMGYTSALRDVYRLDMGAAIPHTLELRSIEDVKLQPSYAVGEHLRFVEQKLRPQLATKLDGETARVMSSTDLGDELTPAMVERNPALREICKRLSGKKMRTLGGTLITVGLGIAAACVAINEHRNRLTACMLYYYDDNGQLRRCVIATCTCKKVACTKNCNYCDTDTLRKYLPVDMLVDNCGDYRGSSAGCAKCPSDDYNRTNLDDESTLTAATTTNTSFVRCQKPNFFEALSDLFGGVSEDLLGIVKGSLNGISWLVSILPYVIAFALVGIAVVILISIFGKLRNRGDTVNYVPLQQEKQSF